MANHPDPLRTALIAGANGPIAAIMLELEKALLEHGQVQVSRFEDAQTFIDAIWHLNEPAPHFVLIGAEPEPEESGLQTQSNRGLNCLENLRQLERFVSAVIDA